MKYNCEICSDPITDEKDMVSEYTLWTLPDRGTLPYHRLTGRVAHRTCIIAPRETESGEVHPDQLSLLENND